jgi:hypothetical protein
MRTLPTLDTGRLTCTTEALRALVSHACASGRVRRIVAD